MSATCFEFLQKRKNHSCLLLGTGHYPGDKHDATSSTLARISEGVSIRKIVLCISLALISSRISFPAAGDENRWWPVQAMPKALARLRQNEFPEPRAACEMMAQSVAGLAAKAVNESCGDEMVWVETDNVDIEDWLGTHSDGHGLGCQPSGSHGRHRKNRASRGQELRPADNRLE